MTVTLGACVRQILCPLDGAVRNALAVVINTTISVMQAELLTLEATILALQPQRTLALAARDIALAAIDAASVPTNLVPLTLIAGCAGLGDMMAGISLGLDAARADVIRLVNEANRYITLDAFLRGKVAEISAAIEQLEAVAVVLGDCP